MSTNHELEMTEDRKLGRSATAEMLARERARIGSELSRPQMYIEVATKDAIRHWAWGIGDRNPLWTDETYARGTPWGGILAPSTIVLSMMRSALGLPGLHGWHLHTSFEWPGPIRRDTSFTGRSVFESLEEVESRYANGVAFDQTIRHDISNAETDEPVVTIRSVSRRFERAAGARSKKYAAREKQVYTDAELAEIVAGYDREEIRGSTPRFVEDVQVGDGLPRIVRGPLTVMDCIAFELGWGGAFLFAHGFAYDFLKKHPDAFPRNGSNIPDSPERTHWVDTFAQAIGAPAAFDYGPQRIAWCGTLITNWMGDAGVLRHLHPRILLPNYHGDTVWITGRVERVSLAEQLVEVTYEGRNQLDEIVVDGTGAVELPTRVAHPA